MGEEIRHHSTRVRRRRRHKSSVTNINIFAMTSSPEVATEPAAPAPVPAPPPVPPAEHEDEDLFGERLVSSEWLERRAKRLENQEQELNDVRAELGRHHTAVTRLQQDAARWFKLVLRLKASGRIESPIHYARA